MKQQMQNLIYSVACKDLTFGCEIKYPDWDTDEKIIEANMNKGIINYTKGDWLFLVGGEETLKEGIEVIGHPVMFGDIVDSFTPYQFAELNHYLPKLARLWLSCESKSDKYTALRTSLNELMEGEWEKELKNNTIGAKGTGTCTVTEFPKKKEVKELFEFLLSLNL